MLSSGYEQVGPAPVSAASRQEAQDGARPTQAAPARTTHTQSIPAKPLFELGRIQYDLPGPLLHIAAAANKLLLCIAPVDATPMRLVYLDLDDPSRTQEALLPPPIQARGARWRQPTESTRVFIDPTAQHALACTGTHTYYWTPSWPRARRVQQLDGVPVTAVGWGRPRTDPPVPLPSLPGTRKWIWTPPVLLGTARGDLVETTVTAQVGEDRFDLFDRWARKSAGSIDYPLERGTYRLYSLASDAHPITGLSVEMKEKCALIIVATSSRLYEFVGEVSTSVSAEASPVFLRVFDSYKQSLQPHWKTDLPPGLGTLLTVTSPVASPPHGSTARMMAWLTGAGIYAAQIEAGTGISGADLVVPPRMTESPIAMGRTPLHYVLVYADSLVCMNALDPEVKYEVPLQLQSHEQVQGLVVDRSSHMCWMYTSMGGILELLVHDEARDMWHLLLKRQLFASALKFCRDDESRKQVLENQGNALLASGNALKAVECYAEARSPSFEHVALALMDAAADNALRRYVKLCLDALPRTARVQRLMLATWLLELFVRALHASEKESEMHHHLMSETESILRQHDADLDPSTTYALLARQGCIDVWITYANIRHDVRKILQHWIDQKCWDKALHALSSQSSPDMYYQFAMVLMRNAPGATVQCWQRCADSLDIERLIPALLQHKPATTHSTDFSLVYLQYMIDVQGCKSPAAHALRLTRLVARDNETPALLAFIENASPEALDLSYALRICSSAGRREACVRLYARMHQYENAVHLALDADDVDLACLCADLAAGQPALQRELWLQCAKHVVHTQATMEEAMKFLLRTDLLTVEDILPFFPDFSVIDGFKTEICDTLESYVARIGALKEDMDRTSNTASNIQQDIEQLSKRVMEIDADHPCRQCGAPLLERQLYLFPCRHGFHADCLTQLVAQHLSPQRLRRLLQLQNELNAVTVSTAAADTHSASPQSSKASPLPLSNSLERLREHVRPQAIVDAIANGFTVGATNSRRALVPQDPSTSLKHISSKNTQDQQILQQQPHHRHHRDSDIKSSSTQPSARTDDVDERRAELNSIVAGTCPICTWSVQEVATPFTDDKDSEDGDDWLV